MLRGETPVACPACNAQRTYDLGPLPAFGHDMFGGRPTDCKLDPGHLHHCGKCDLAFRHPYPKQEDLTELYEKLPADIWHSSPFTEPSIWGIVRKLIYRYAEAKKILDVGCYHGGFLSGFPADWVRTGVEPSVAARQAATNRGIDVPGRTIEELPNDRTGYGAVSILDVIEHLRNPLAFLANLVPRLSPRGCIVIQTGAFDSPAFRLFGRHYWYSSLPEHVSFTSIRWFRWAGHRLGMRVQEFRRLSAFPGTLFDSLREATKLTLYTGIQLLRERKYSLELVRRIPFLGRAVKWTTVPWWGTAKDHIIIVLTRI